MLRSDHSAFSSRLPVLLQEPALLLAVFLAAFAFGCTPKIGDSCTVSTNCSASGDRLCDITEPGGYCTIFNCEPNSCPEDSACINFGTQLSSLPMCSPSQGNSPYQRSFCMATCGNDGDCRGGYKCVNMTGDAAHPNNVGAVLADYTGNGMVCVANPDGLPPDTTASTGVCTGDPDAGTVSAGEAGASGGGASGADSGVSGAAGAAGSNDAGAGG